MRDKTRLILFAHGSRDPVWQATFQNLTRELGAELGTDRIGLAFMEFAQPDLDTSLAEARADGVFRVRLLPLFLSAGGHVARDIPRLADEARLRFPDLAIDVLPPIGEDRAFSALVGSIARTALRDAAKTAESGHSD